MEWKVASDIEEELIKIVNSLNLSHLKTKRIFCFRSFGSTSRAQARIWSLPRIWQQALQAQPAYCIEILSEKFDQLSKNEQKRVLIHELLHIPKNFSGSLLPHRNSRGVSFGKRAEKLFQDLLNFKHEQ